MSSDLTAGYKDECYDGLGGIDWAAAVQLTDLSSMTVNAAEDEVTAMSMNNTKRAYDFHFEPETASFVDVQTVNAANGSRYSAQSLTIMLNNMDKATRNVVMSLASRRTIWLVRLANGTYKVLGAHLGMKQDTGTGNSGAVRDDRQGYELALSVNEKLMAYDIDEAVVLSLLLPAS